MAEDWSSRHVVTALMRHAPRWTDRAWICSYFLGRRSPPLLGRALGGFAVAERPLDLDGLESPLHLRVDTGGLGTYYEIVIRRIYAPEPRFEPSAGQTVVDVGANVGVFSAWAAGRIGPAGRLLAIEPNPGACEMLEKNLAPHPFAVIAPYACSDETAEMVLQYPPGRLSVGSLTPRPDRTERVRVPVRRLDDVVTDAGLGDVDLVKIDVEGVELEVLAGAPSLLERTRRLVMEIDLDQHDAVVEELARSGLSPVGSVTGMWGLARAAIVHFERP